MSQTLEKYFLLLNNKLDRVREAESLTLVQYNLIEEEKYDKLLEHVEKRAAVMAQFKQFDDEIQKLDIADISEADKDKAEAIEDDIKKVLARIQVDNEKLRAMVVKCKEECADQIRQHNENKKGIMGYMQYGMSDASKFFDKKS